jgi:hypothetical protein
VVLVAWKMIQNRLPMKDNHVRCGIVGAKADSHLCNAGFGFLQGLVLNSQMVGFGRRYRTMLIITF